MYDLLPSKHQAENNPYHNWRQGKIAIINCINFACLFAISSLFVVENIQVHVYDFCHSQTKHGGCREINPILSEFSLQTYISQRNSMYVQQILITGEDASAARYQLSSVTSEGRFCHWEVKCQEMVHAEFDHTSCHGSHHLHGVKLHMIRTWKKIP